MAQSGEGASGLYRGAQAGYFRSGAISFRHRERRFEFLEPVVRAAFQRTSFSASYLLPVHYEDNPCAKPPSERLQYAVPGYARPERVAGQRYDDALSGSCGAVRQHRPAISGCGVSERTRLPGLPNLRESSNVISRCHRPGRLRYRTCVSIPTGCGSATRRCACIRFPTWTTSPAAFIRMTATNASRRSVPIVGFHSPLP